MARAALVVCLIAVAAAPVGAAQGATAAGTKYVVRGVVVQYIPPAGSVVGSLSIRVLSAGAHGRALLGELVTVPVARGKALNANRLVPQRSRCTVTLSARSPASILKGAAVVQTIVSRTPGASDGNGQPGNAGHAPTVDPDATSPAGGAAAGRDNPDSAPSNDHATGQGEGRDSGKGSGAAPQSNAPGSQGRGSGGNSNAHK